MRVGETTLTAALLAACAVLAAGTLLPRLAERPAPLRVERPDITASVEGAVAHPGAYRLPWGARVTDLVGAAGGLLPGAARELVALADPLTDGEVVQVPRERAEGGDPRVRLNEAGVEALTRLPGIGPALARRIVAARPFATVDDLLRVPGIGPKTLAALRPRVRL
ncbi:MAG: ComEA family DNA-binding protein [Deinococcales bacterium]